MKLGIFCLDSLGMVLMLAYLLLCIIFKEHDMLLFWHHLVLLFYKPLLKHQHRRRKKSRKKEFQRRFETSSFVQRMVKTPKSIYGWLFKKYFHPSLTTLNLITACYNAHTSQQCDVLISCVAISDEINSCQEWGWAFDEIQDEIPCQFLGISNLPTDQNFTTHFPAIIFIPCFTLAFNKP